MRTLSVFLALLLAVPVFAQDATVAADIAASSVERGPVSRTRSGGGIIDPARAPAYYVTARTVELRAAPSDTAPVIETLRIRDGVRVLGEAGPEGDESPTAWRLVQYGERRGYVRASALSNVWIRVDKSERTVYVYRGAELIRELPADVSMSDEDKERRSELGETNHYRMPEGVFFITRLNTESQYYRAFVVSYPGPVHAMRGLRDGIISESEYQEIVRADQEGREPPMGTRLGGLIEIHGSGSGRRTAWTRGCVALRNVHMDELWAYVEVGTPVIIEP